MQRDYGWNRPRPDADEQIATVRIVDRDPLTQDERDERRADEQRMMSVFEQFRSDDPGGRRDDR